MEIYAITSEDYSGYEIEKVFLNKNTANKEYDQKISLEKENYEKKYNRSYEKRGYSSNIGFRTFKTED